MDTVRIYEVAGHSFSLSLPDGVNSERILGAYKPFLISAADDMRVHGDGSPDYMRVHGDGGPDDCGCLFSVRVEMGDLPEAGSTAGRFNDEAPYIWVFRGDDGAMNFGFSFTPEKPGAILMVRGNSATLHLPQGIRYREADNYIGNSMMLMFAYHTAAHDTLMIHASVTVRDGRGYVFLGRSGTGKSTHSRLWLENIPGTWLLNDDNPVIRIVDGTVRVFGTPWSGKTPCYINDNVPVGGIVRLEQAPHNEIRRLGTLEAYAALAPSCSSMSWDRDWADAENRTLEKVISTVKCWHLKCLPDADAALLSSGTCCL